DRSLQQYQCCAVRRWQSAAPHGSRSFRMNLFTRVCLLAMSLGLAAAPASWGGEDVGGSKDHPLLTRYPNSYITEYTKNYNATDFPVGAKGAPPKAQTVEGDTTTIR